MFLISIIEFSFYITLSGNVTYTLTKTQQMVIKDHFVIASLFLGFGFALFIVDRLKCNYAFIFTLPPGLESFGHRRFIKYGSIQMSVVALCSVLCICS